MLNAKQHRICNELIKNGNLAEAEKYFEASCIRCALTPGRRECGKQCALKEMQEIVENWFVENTTQDCPRWA